MLRGLHDEIELPGDTSGPWSFPGRDQEEAGEKVQTQHVRRKRWRLTRSIWSSRPQTSNSHDFYETIESLRPAFMADWTAADVSHGLDAYIKRIKSSMPGQGEIRDTPVNEKDETIREAMWQNVLVIYGAFDFYCCKYAATVMDAGKQDVDIYSMSFNGFMAFARDAKFLRFCPAGVLQLIFATVDINDRNVKERLGATKSTTVDVLNQSRRLNRHEFVEATARICIARYAAGARDSPTISDAIFACCQDMCTHLTPEVQQSSDKFRTRFCYIEATDGELVRHGATLKALFERYSEINQDYSNSTSNQRLLSCSEWLALVEHLGFLDTGNLTTIEARLIFSWSRIRSVSDYSNRSQMRLRNLQFEDFLEAVVRMSLMVALPTDEEVSAAGAPDAGAYLLQMRNKKIELDEFIAERKAGWADEPVQHVARCVDHLLCLVARLVERNTRGDRNMMVSSSEAKQFVEMGRAHTLQRANTLSLALAEEGAFRKNREAVAEGLLAALSQVPAFGGLSQEQLVLLRDSMTAAPFHKEDVVINQGDVGDCFYVIIEGKVEVLRDDPENKGFEVVINAAMGEYEFFGERALIKSEPRFASVKALTDLKTMSITQAKFEEVMGQPLSEMLPDYY